MNVVPSGLVVTETTRQRNLDLFADILNGFRVHYHYWLARTRRNRTENQSENCDEEMDAHCNGLYPRLRIGCCTITLIL